MSIDIEVVLGIKGKPHDCASCGRVFTAGGWILSGGEPWPADCADASVCGGCMSLAGPDAIVVNIRKRKANANRVVASGFGKLRGRQRNETCPVCGSMPGDSCVSGPYRDHVLHIFPTDSAPFPIEDAGPHPKDEK